MKTYLVSITSARRNVCVVEYKDVDETILKETFISNTNSHSEELMLEYLKENNILGKDIIKIFSEREPCVETVTNIGHNCTNRIIEYMPDVEVVYAIEYGATRESGLNARNSLKKYWKNY